MDNMDTTNCINEQIMSRLSDTLQQLRTLQQSYDELVQNYNSLVSSITIPVGMPSYEIDNDTAQVQIQPNVLYNFTNRTNNLTITFATGVQNTNKTNEYHFKIQIGNTVPTITLPASVDFSFDINTEGQLKPNKIYEFSVLDNVGLMCEW